jgi:FAD/FMN-containing dehydrogenase
VHGEDSVLSVRLANMMNSYVNFAHGDETPEAIYGSSLPKLKQLKKKYDPSGVFNQWFTIKP